MNQPMIEVLSIQPLRNAGAIKAKADINIGGLLTMFGMKIIEQSGKSAWVGTPSKEYTAGGERRFAPIVKLSPELADAVTRAVLAGWQAYKKNNTEN